MKPILTSTMLLLSAVAISITGCVETVKAPNEKLVPGYTGGSSETPSKKPSGRKPNAGEAWLDDSNGWAVTTQQGAHGRMYTSWHRGDEGVWTAAMPNGHKFVWTEKWGNDNAYLGGTMSLSNGQKFVLQMSNNTARNTKDMKLIFPNGQSFASEGAAGDYSLFPLVSDDGALVVLANSATHIYLKRADGRYREIPNGNGQIDKLLKQSRGVVAGNMELVSLEGRTHRTLSCVGQADGAQRFWFKVNVGPDGTLSLQE